MPYAPNMYDFAHAHAALQSCPAECPATTPPRQCASGRAPSHLHATAPCRQGLNSSERMSIDQLPQYIDMVAKAREGYAGRIDVLPVHGQATIPRHGRLAEDALHAQSAL